MINSNWSEYFSGAALPPLADPVPSTRRPVSRRNHGLPGYNPNRPADARPIYVPVALSEPVDVSDMEWVKVTRTAEFSTNEGQTHVLLKADSVDASDPPEEAMLY